MEVWQIVGLSIIVGILVVTYLFCLFMDIKRYNKGVCPHCGEKLTMFDINRHGERGYACDECGNYLVWIDAHIDRY